VNRPSISIRLVTPTLNCKLAVELVLGPGYGSLWDASPLLTVAGSGAVLAVAVATGVITKKPVAPAR